MSVLAKLLAFALFLALSCATAQQATSQPLSLPVGSATVADLKGDVSLHSPQGDVLTPQKSLVLIVDSTIETGKGSILLSLQDGSEILVKSHSRVVLRSPEVGIGLYLELLLGKVMAKVQKRLGEAPPFRMGTPSAVITVRGTRFEVEVTKKQQTYVQVFEGVVEVRGLTNPRAVLLRPNFSTQVQLGGDPQPPRNLTEEVQEFGDRIGQTERTGRETERPEAESPGREQDSEREHHPD